MKLHRKIAIATSAAAFMATPAQAADMQYRDPFAPGGHRGGQKAPGPKAQKPAKARAYGRYCRGQSQKHVKGMKGTPFSQCVKAMAKLSKGNTTSPRAACKGEPKKHVKGMKGTPFSVCVKGAAKLLEDQRAQDR